MADSLRAPAQECDEMNAAPPSFDEWVTYCFTYGHSDFSGTSPDGEGLSRQGKLASSA